MVKFWLENYVKDEIKKQKSNIKIMLENYSPSKWYRGKTIGGKLRQRRSYLERLPSESKRREMKKYIFFTKYRRVVC
jgi:hypothetical protein